MERCGICGKPFKVKGTGRPRLYCGDRCKERARRVRDAKAERESRELVADHQELAAVCRVCQHREATVGLDPAKPILCEPCSRA